MTAAPLLLACLLAAPQDLPPEGAANAPPTGVALQRLAAARLDAALDAPLAERVVIAPGATLAEALNTFAELRQIIILPDTPRLDLEGVDLRDLQLDGGLTVPAGRFPTRMWIEELLDAVTDVPLTYLNDGGILKITTQDYADERLFVVVYPVRDLLEAAGPAHAAAWRAPQFQGFGGGMSGGMRVDETGQPLPNAGGFSLPAVANQFGAGGFAPPAPQPVPDTPLGVALAAEAPLEDLILTVTGGLDNGGGWEDIDGTGGSLEFFNGVLTVRQTQAVHREIDTLLTDLRAAFREQPWSFPVELPQAEAAPPAPATATEEPTE